MGELPALPSAQRELNKLRVDGDARKLRKPAHQFRSDGGRDGGLELPRDGHEELIQDLGGYDYVVGLLEQRPSDLLLGGVRFIDGVDEDVGVEEGPTCHTGPRVSTCGPWGHWRRGRYRRYSETQILPAWWDLLRRSSPDSHERAH